MWCFLTFIFGLISFMETRSVPENATAILISKYAKVAHWGVNNNETRLSIENLGRRNGQALWTHRSDVNLVNGQGIKSDKPRVVNHYPTYKRKHSKIDEEKVERLPAVGEVIQDRYNPRPYFGYGKIPPKSESSATYGVPKPTQSAFNFNIAPSTPNSVDLYTSPYNSYNPPPVMSVNPVTDSYPPSGQDSYATPPPSDNQGYDYPPPLDSQAFDYPKPQEPSYASLGPPLAPQYTSDVDDDSMPPSDHDNVDAPPSDHIPINHDHGPPHHPPKNEDDIYYPPEGFSNDAHDHSPKGFMPAPDMHTDLAPPDHGRFPQYLYDSHHFDHHVYEEVPHTTTEAPEDKRVSSGNYSYYYLGRKLWYVPLYFSIYFIIYVAVLILKAIARHKVQYKHKWAAAASARSGRELDFDKNEYIEDVTRNVTNAVDKVKRMYVYAM